ncbi:MAG: hypothetical protein UW39_C0032G0013 [Parcubacteria group bacterium GW2011_GWC2_44_17]|uniref:Uncharacterized protein n=1 Tax=Candidatus Jacksonbacteria bacterium RIFCSPLOWO2_02_FULL_44_20 TaxID=1798460 RepID=A0A1G2A9I4_9BACT|nr:MAG: hypothetical protein UW39_C0032G0013 [Parcubacteria group bacterium GW2011_GWC2_44_17]KKT48288.1 MAG: hypothetical protein UW40_C0048G0012 [Parcubacteria group bacterium GW2011_GWF2_44_17]OGY69972.1 MAG: hypothetical protein A3C00_04305 [Candidatus Jacksonbacteria bacterium RIFCSPHIGHO2_02_FULL_44_25]OGY72654.1 MAG: hypothetical protein A3E05_02375 [Candidatus Jacksonbacteria bacterium RIFCSPHIGHO2_12_FULL_44_12]OGY73335.1 MAG: hypothetical protein A3H61_00220 [Candidatus Jacksonbacteri
MNATKILQSAGLNPNDSIFSLDNEEAVERLLEFIEEWKLQIQVKKISKEDWKTLLSSYADSIVDYHPENDHQERGAFLRNEEMLMKYGLTQEDITRLDFC